MNLRPSITFKLFLAFLGLLVLALGFLGTLSTLWFVREQSQALDRFLELESQGVENRLEGLVNGLAENRMSDSRTVRQVLVRELPSYLAQRLNRPVPYKTTLVIFDDQNLVLARSNSALDLSDTPVRPADGHSVYRDVRDQGPAYRVLTSSYPLGQGTRGTFQLACLLSSLDAPLNSFLISLLVVLGGSLVLLSFLGAGLIGLTLRPVRLMAKAAEAIGEENLGSRIPTPPGNDDLSRLSRTLNGLLGRLETDYAFQERLVEDLTHQLKTPLTILRGRNELGLTTRKSTGEFRELLEDNLSDIDALVNLLNTLLELARLDGRIDRLTAQPVDLGALAAEMGEELEPLWHSKGLAFEALGPRLTVLADPQALKQVLTNLFDNAWKFSPAGGRVRIWWEAGAEKNEVRIVVANDGPPIADQDLEKIFKRFYRVPTEGPAPAGAGLGLSIVRSLVEVQGGRVRAFTPVEGGAAFEIVLPWGSGDK